MQKIISVFFALTFATLGIAQKVQPDSLRVVKPYVIRHYQNAKTHKANAGIIIVEDGAHTRAMNPYNGGADSGIPYAEVANNYKRTMSFIVLLYYRNQCLCLSFHTNPIFCSSFLLST